MKKVEKDAAIGCAFMFMEKACLTESEIDSYLEILNGLLPEDHILFGVSNSLDFLTERYGVIKKVDDLYYIAADANAFHMYFIFRTPKYQVELFKEACEILKAVEEISDEVKTSDNMILNRTN